MKLHVGQRLPGSGPPNQPGGYLVTEVLRETSWSNLYGARKILYNFDFANQRCRESDEGEWLDVLLRTCSYDDLQSPQEATHRRAAAREEVRAVLARCASNVWPEPLDLLEMGGDAQGQQTADTEPIVVLARPRGQPLRDWLGTRPLLPARLALLAELLTFMEESHQLGILLNSLAPEALIVDEQGRPGYLASDCAVPVDAQRGDQPTPSALFPSAHYPIGFSAPECFDAASPRDKRSDLFAWSALALFVLTGDDPRRHAEAQGEPWLELQVGQVAKLHEALRHLSASEVWTLAESFGAEPEAFAAIWPRNLVRVVERGLMADAEQRPASVAEIHSWLLRPPPPLPRAALTIAVPGSAEVRVLYELPAWDRPSEVIVWRSGTTATTPAAHGLVAEGLTTGWLSVAADTGGTASGYRVCLREFAGDRQTSAAIAAPLIGSLPREWRQHAERGAALAQINDPEPPHVALLFRAYDPLGVAEAMLSSAAPAVRAWATRRLINMWGQGDVASKAESLLWRVVEDTNPGVRRLAVEGLLTGSLQREQVVQLFETLAGRPRDEGAHALEVLQRQGADEATQLAARDALSAARRVRCPECGTILAQRDLYRHLLEGHGYLEEAGAVRPRAAVLAQLWDRVFTSGDREAHNRLLGLLTDHGAAADRLPTYVRALETQLESRAEQIFAARWQEMPRLVRCLRSGEAALPLIARLLHSPDRRVREIVQEVLLAELAARLSSGDITAGDIRRRLDWLCPGERLEDKILLCGMLSRAGVKAEAVAQCLTRLEQERPVACQACGIAVPGVELEAHLRRAHRIFQFRGQVRSLAETLTFLLDAVCGRRADSLAWTTLETIVREEHPADADDYLVSWLGQRLLRVAGDKQQEVIAAAAGAVAASQSGPRMAVLLASTPTSAWQGCAFQLALEIAEHLPAPLAPQVLAALQPLVGDRRLPAEARLKATAQLVQTVGPSGPAAEGLLRTFATASGKVKGVERLQRLEQRVGKMPAIDRLCAELEDQVRMSCPRCGVELRRAEMAHHLWDEHRLMLEGRRVREPWRVIEDWLEDFRLEGDRGVLLRCRQVAQDLDPHSGQARLQRLLLQHGIEDGQARKALIAEARRQRASVCPYCFVLVPALGEPAPPRLHAEEGAIESGGFRVEVSTAGLVPLLEIETPRGMVYDGREPGRSLTKLGAVLFLAGPLFVLAGVLGFAPLHLPVPGLLPAALAGGLGLVVVGMILLAGNPTEGPQDRAVDHAWSRLVPHLLAEELAPEEQEFIAALAGHSLEYGDEEVRTEALKEVVAVLETAVAAGAPATYLGAVRRLALHDSTEDVDVVPRLVEQLGRCFDGSLPITFASTLLGPSESQGWSDVDKRRVRVLACARAFDDGLELRDVLDLGAANPSLGTLLDIKNPDLLAHLRVLRTLEASRPWERLGGATTIFDIAKDPHSSRRVLGRLPDALLVADAVPALSVCARGLLFDNLWVVEPPEVIEIIARTLFEEGGYHLVIEQHTFWFAEDPAPLAALLEKWIGFFFRELRPQLDSVYRGRRPTAANRLVARNGILCPECRRQVLPVPGDMALAGETPWPEQVPIVLPA